MCVQPGYLFHVLTDVKAGYLYTGIFLVEWEQVAVCGLCTSGSFLLSPVPHAPNMSLFTHITRTSSGRDLYYSRSLGHPLRPLCAAPVLYFVVTTIPDRVVGTGVHLVTLD